ncbi:MAG: ParB/RepB/Spo0J family partition protein [Candidatus Theseobacter exili]|nr:ParB/RepB/Spo0J family partition protein [Candidatus Theseobacter exili]
MAKKALGRGLSALIPEASGKVVLQAPSPKVEKPKEKTNDSVSEIDVSKISRNPYQPRKQFDEEKMKELMESIESNGIIQPVVVRKKSKGLYELIAGERRWTAIKQLGIKTIPVVVKKATDEKSLELALVENLQRDDLNPMEAANAFARLMSDYKLTQEAVARQLGKSRSVIANTVRLLLLPAEIQELIEKGRISAGHAKVILGLRTDIERIQLAREIVSVGYSVRETEEKVVRKARISGKRKSSSMLSPALLDAQEALSEHLGTRVRVRKGSKKGHIEIEFYSGDDLQRLLDVIGVKEE